MAWRGKAIYFFEKVMDTFESIWQLLSPQGEYKRRQGACRRLWGAYDIEKQRRIYAAIVEKRKRGETISPNPYFAIEDAAIGLAGETRQPQTLSYNDYYARYGTTEPQDGWRMANPTGQKVIYVKQ